MVNQLTPAHTTIFRTTASTIPSCRTATTLGEICLSRKRLPAAGTRACGGRPMSSGSRACSSRARRVRVDHCAVNALALMPSRRREPRHQDRRACRRAHRPPYLTDLVVPPSLCHRRPCSHCDHARLTHSRRPRIASLRRTLACAPSLHASIDQTRTRLPCTIPPRYVFAPPVVFSARRPCVMRAIGRRATRARWQRSWPRPLHLCTHLYVRYSFLALSFRDRVVLDGNRSAPPRCNGLPTSSLAVETRMAFTKLEIRWTGIRYIPVLPLACMRLNLGNEIPLDDQAKVTGSILSFA
jgi:hypothetical protein